MFFDPTTEQVIVRIVYEAGGRSPREVLEEVRRLLWVDGAEVVEPMDALARVEHSGGMVSGVPLRNELFACSAAKVGAEAFAWLVENSDAVVVVDDAPDLKRASVTAMREAVARWAEKLRPGTIKMLPPREAPRRLEREARRRAEEEQTRRRAEFERRRAEEQARRAAEEEERRRQAKRRAEIRAELEARWRARAEAAKQEPARTVPRPPKIVAPRPPKPPIIPDVGPPPQPVMEAPVLHVVPDEITSRLEPPQKPEPGIMQSLSVVPEGAFVTSECTALASVDLDLPQSWWDAMVARMRRMFGGEGEEP